MNTSGHYDVAIIGAGINGAGIARDAALRGLKVIILDKNDVCSGTSAISSRLIHGGLRYLEYGEIPLVYESLRERRILQRVAPHLVTPIRIAIPIFEGARRGRLLIRLGMIVYDFLSFRKSLPGHDMLGREDAVAEEPGMRAEGLRGFARYFDAQITFSERLVVENLIAARAAEASIANYTEVISIETAGDDGFSIGVRDSQADVTHLTASTVINAAGPWVDEVLKTNATATPRLVGGTKGSHIVVGQFPGAPRDAIYVEAEADGRPIFIIPWNDLYLIGTTDIRYEESLDHIRASGAEVSYLLNETNRVFPTAELTLAKVHYAYAGVRPLPYKTEGPESAITRKHIIKVNSTIADGLVSIIGGKITTYRNLAEQAVDKLQKLLRRDLPTCRTAEMPLPGAVDLDATRTRLAAVRTLSQQGVARLLRVYGGRATGIAELAEQGGLSEPLATDGAVLAAEIVFVIREEFAKTLTDIFFRRTMLGLDADQGRPLYVAVAAVVRQELGWSVTMEQQQLDELVEYADSLLVT